MHETDTRLRIKNPDNHDSLFVIILASSVKMAGNKLRDSVLAKRKQVNILLCHQTGF